MDRSFLLLVIFPLGVLCQTLQESDPGILKPSDQLRVTCTVSGFELTNYGVHWVRQPPGGALQWLGGIWSGGGTNYAESMKSRLSITRDTAKKVVTLQMNSMETKDSGAYYCARDDSYVILDLWGSGTTITVTSAEKRAPSVFPLVPCSGSLSTSQDVTFGCLSSGYLPAPVDVTWNSGSITTGIRNFPDVLAKSGTYLSSSLLTVSADDYKNKKYTCNVNHKATGQTVNKEIDVAVVGPKLKEPTVEVMQASCGETGSVDLVCLVSGYSPSDINIQWLLNGEATSINPRNSTPYKDNDGNFGTRSDVSVPKSDWISGDSYTCRVTHPPTQSRKEDNIHKCPESGGSNPRVTLLPPSPKELLITNQPKVTCEVSKLDSTESLRITWSRSDNKRGQVFKSDPESDFDGKLSVKSTMRITVEDWNSGKTFTCTVQHDDLASPIEKQIHKREVSMTDPQINVFPPTKEELSTYDFVGVNCLLSGFSHKDVYVQWKKNGQVLDAEHYINTEPIQDNETESYIMYSRLIIQKSDWMRESKFTCCSALSTIKCKDIKIEKCRGK